MTETKQPYPEPVSRLLELGDVREEKEWRDYRALGLSEQDVPELSRMLLDEELAWADSEGVEVWAGLHAWRALAQLKAESAVPALIELLGRADLEDDWASNELPLVFAEMGPAALEPLRTFLADTSQDRWPRILAGESLVKLGQRYPELRAEVVAALGGQLAGFAHQEQSFNGLLISNLVDLQAVEAAPVMEQAFAAGKVDLLIQGDWEDIQIRLGLLDERLTPPPDNRALMAAQMGFDPAGLLDNLERVAQASLERKAERQAASQAKAKARAKRKQAQKSRKKQRKRR
jgi:hypothetical protein